MRSYNKIPYNKNLLLDLPFYEGADPTTIITRDQALPTPHEDIEFNVTGASVIHWDRTQYSDGAYDRGFGLGYDYEHIGPFDLGFAHGFHPSLGLGVLYFESGLPTGASGCYLDLPAANCVDLDFVNDDYSYGVWINWIDNGYSQIIIGRYELNVAEIAKNEISFTRKLMRASLILPHS